MHGKAKRFFLTMANKDAFTRNRLANKKMPVFSMEGKNTGIVLFCIACEWWF